MGSRSSTMTKNNEDRSSQVGKALGASRAGPLPASPSGGPLDLLELRANVAGRLKSSGGRPTDPDWNVQRLVPFQEDRWHQLEELARALSTDERKVSAGQLAAILIERALDSMSTARGRR